MIHPLLNRLIAKGIVVNSTIFVDENIDISISEDTFYPTSLGYVIATYLLEKDIINS